MKIGQTGFVLGLAVLAAIWLAGCIKPANQRGAPKGAEAHDHEHDHAHHGPHHGHLMEIGEEQYHAEWTHDESGKVTFYILDAEAKKEVPISADEIVIDVKLGDNKPVTYKLAAVNPTDGKSAAFETTDKQLLGVFETLKSPGVVATLHVNINGKQFDQRIEEHEHAH
jgi:hypothetical protein